MLVFFGMMLLFHLLLSNVAYVKVEYCRHKLFVIYIDDLIQDLRKSGYGTYIGRLFICAIAYADDIFVFYRVLVLDYRRC